jgi:hypothetical protein
MLIIIELLGLYPVEDAIAPLDGFAAEIRSLFLIQANSEMTQYEALLQKNHDHTLSDTERTELTTLRVEGDQFMLCKAQAAAILRWRGHTQQL